MQCSLRSRRGPSASLARHAARRGSAWGWPWFGSATGSWASPRRRRKPRSGSARRNPDPSRLLKKAHLRHPSSEWVPGALARRCDVRTKYASHLHPSCGWVPGTPPSIWTFLSSLAENEFFSVLLDRSRTANPPSADKVTTKPGKLSRIYHCPLRLGGSTCGLWPFPATPARPLPTQKWPGRVRDAKADRLLSEA